MFDPQLKVKVIADFKYKNESFAVAGSHLVFDIYDSLKIAELVVLYGPNYEYRNHIELPSVDSLPYHIKQQLNDQYKSNKPADSVYTPVSDKPFYETIEKAFSPYGYSPHEAEEPVVAIANSTHEPYLEEPRFPLLVDIKPSVFEEKEPVKDELVKDEVEEVEELVKVDETVELEPTKEEKLETAVKEYTAQTAKLLTLSADQLEDKSASDIKRALLEVDPTYDYTNKVEAIKYLITLK